MLDAHYYDTHWDPDTAHRIETYRASFSALVSADEAASWFQARTTDTRVAQALLLLSSASSMHGIDAWSLLPLLKAQCDIEAEGVGLVLEQLADIPGGPCPSGQVHRLVQLLWI
jgi:hypothetical protein